MICTNKEQETCNEESKEDIEELKRLFYSDRLTQNGKRKLIRYYEKRIKQLEEENKSKQKAYDDCYCEYKHYKQFDSIPKSKVIEKIKELEDGTYDAKIILQQLLKD